MRVICKTTGVYLVIETGDNAFKLFQTKYPQDERIVEHIRTRRNS